MKRTISDFDNFRFNGLGVEIHSNKYLTMKRYTEDENKIVVKVGDNHLIKTAYGYALILDDKHVVFLKKWQVSINYYGNEVLLSRDFWNVKEWGNHELFDKNEKNLNYETWLETAKEQKTNKVLWEG